MITPFPSEFSRYAIVLFTRMRFLTCRAANLEFLADSNPWVRTDVRVLGRVVYLLLNFSFPFRNC